MTQTPMGEFGDEPDIDDGQVSSEAVVEPADEYGHELELPEPNPPDVEDQNPGYLREGNGA